MGTLGLKKWGSAHSFHVEFRSSLIFEGEKRKPQCSGRASFQPVVALRGSERAEHESVKSYSSMTSSGRFV